MANKNAKNTTDERNQNASGVEARNAQSPEEKMESVTPNGEVRETNLYASPVQVSGVDMADLERLEHMQRGYNYQPSYIEFDKAGQTLRCVYLGRTEITVNDNDGGKKKLPVVMLINPDGIFYQGGVNLLGKTELVKIGSPIEIEYTGTEKTGSGNKVKVFDVYSLVDTQSQRIEEGVVTQDVEVEVV